MPGILPPASHLEQYVPHSVLGQSRLEGTLTPAVGVHSDRLPASLSGAISSGQPQNSAPECRIGVGPIATALTALSLVLRRELDEPARRGSESPLSIHKGDLARDFGTGFDDDATKGGGGLGQGSRE